MKDRFQIQNNFKNKTILTFFSLGISPMVFRRETLQELFYWWEYIMDKEYLIYLYLIVRMQNQFNEQGTNFRTSTQLQQTPRGRSNIPVDLSRRSTTPSRIQ